MKKFFVMGAAIAMGLALTSCHSSESAYKKAYEKAQAAQNAGDAYAQQYAMQTTGVQTQQTTPVQVTSVTPTYSTQGNTTQPVTVTQPVTTQPVRVTPTTDYSNVAVRTEQVTLVNGAGLKAYSVVVGAFGMLSNAQTLQSTLATKGYNAQIVQATVNGSPFYRVVATTYDTKDEAAQSRAKLMADYPGAWLLYQK